MTAMVYRPRKSTRVERLKHGGRDSVAGKPAPKSESKKSATSSPKKKKTVLSVVGQVVLFGSLGLVGFWLLFSSLWHLNHPSTFVFASSDIDASERQIMYAYFDPLMQRAEFIIAQSEERVSLPKGYGSYQVQAVPGLIGLEKLNKTESRMVFSHALGVVTDEVYLEPRITTPQTSSEMQSWLFSLAVQRLKQLDFVRSLQYFKLLHTWKALPSEQRVLSTTKQTPVRSNFGLNPSTCSLAVINTTGVTGKASTWASILEQSGGRVVRVADEQPEQEQTTLVVASDLSPDCEWWKDRVVRQFSDVRIEISDQGSQQHRASVVVKLGKSDL